VLAQVGWLTAHLTYFSYHAPDKFPSFDDLSGKARKEPSREESEREVRDNARAVVATLKAMNMVAERRGRSNKQD